MRNIGIELVTSNAYARAFAEGVAEYALQKTDWQLKPISQEIGGADIGKLDGLIMRILDDRVPALAMARGVPIVDIYCERLRHGIGQITTDNAGIGRIAAELFLRRGYGNFGWCGIEGITFSTDTAKAFEAAIRKAGGTLQRYDCPKELYERLTLTAPDRIADTVHLRRWLLSLPKPSAVFCCNDHRAYQTMLVALGAGLRIPEEIAILGTDNDTLLCSFAPIALSSIDPGARHLGFSAARMLDAMLRRLPHARLHRPVRIAPVGLVERGSTAYFPQSLEWLSQALLTIEKHLADGISSKDIFKLCDKSTTYVERTFRKHFGMSVQSYIISARIRKAGELLERGNLSIKEIAAECGYSSPQYLCRAFKAATGHSPKAHFSAGARRPCPSRSSPD